MSVLNPRPNILNTRPEKQATNLTMLLQDNYFKVIELPLIEIKDNCSNLDRYQYRIQIEKTDLLIFISANAVIFYFKHFTISNDSPVAVIGKSTAKVFAQYAGRKADIIPESGSDSESLLQHPDLNQLILKQKRNSNILIVRGKGGREYLARQ